MSEKIAELPWRDVDGYRCFGCAPTNEIGLQLGFEPRPDGSILSRFEIDARYGSYPGVVHGGIAATILDELMGNALAIGCSRLCFTTSLRTRFIEPLRTGRRYLGTARVAGSLDGPLYRTNGEIVDEAGALLVTASGSYRTIPEDLARAEMGETWAAWAAERGYLDPGEST